VDRGGTAKEQLIAGAAIKQSPLGVSTADANSDSRGDLPSAWAIKWRCMTFTDLGDLASKHPPQSDVTKWARRLLDELRNTRGDRLRLRSMSTSQQKSPFKVSHV
jgi:hypothetical protein